MPGADHAIVLSAGRLIRTFDAGGVWQEASGPAAVGADGVEWDRSGIEPSRPFFNPLREGAFDPSGASAMAFGDAGHMLASADGGLNWRRLMPPAQGGRALVR